MVYTKEFLISAFLSRYYTLPEAQFFSLEVMAEKFYNESSKDKFRAYCSLDAAALQKYRLEYGS
jgi:hypothetical protein